MFISQFKVGDVRVCCLTTLVGGAASVRSVAVHSQHLTLQADRGRPNTGGAHCREHRYTQ